MKFLAIASVLAASSSAVIANPQSSSSYTGQNVELFNGNVDQIGKVQVIGSGSAIGKVNGNTITGDASGTLKIISQQYGQINIEGAVSGKAGTDGDSYGFVDGAINGRATGPYGVNVAGAAQGKAAGDLDGTFAADGAINGDASAYGYNIRGAAQGSFAGQVNVNELADVSTIEGLGAITDFSKYAGAINGCYTDKEGTVTCTAFDNRNPNAKWSPVSGQQWYGQQMYNGRWVGGQMVNGVWHNGVWVPTGSSGLGCTYPETPGCGGSNNRATSKDGGYYTNLKDASVLNPPPKKTDPSATPSPTYVPTSDASTSSMMLASVFAAVGCVITLII